LAYPIGIDLGTTNSVACVWRRGNAETIPIDGRSTLPSALSIRQDGSVMVGQSAKAKALLDPAASVVSAKRFMGDDKTQWEINGKAYRPLDVSALILRHLKDGAEQYLGESVTDAVITVPAYFNTNQKNDTKLAGEAAGLRVIQLLPEPTAAAISYGLDKDRDQTILVYDLGGGTFDVAVLEVKRNQFRVIAVDGDFHLGGDDFDLLLVEHLIKLMQQRTKADLGLLQSLVRGARLQGTPQEILLARQKLKETAEAAKCELAQADTTQITVPEILGSALDEEITLATYNGLISPLVDRTIAKVRDVLKAARMKADDIDRVILVGGSTRNRLVKERVAAAVKEPWTAAKVDEVVAQGAAIVAGYLSSPEEDVVPIEFTNVTPFSLGVRASKGSDLDIFKPLLSKNASIPANIEHEFTTRRINQRSVDISIFQGEQSHCRDNTFIGGFQLNGIPPAPAGQPKIVVRFEMDNSDLMRVSATCSHLHSEQTLDVNLVSRKDEVPQALPEVDIVFLVDTSGSMSDELEGVKSSCQQFASRLAEAGMDCRVGLVDFALPYGSNYNTEVFGPMDPKRFHSAISGLRIGRIGGGGCYVGEAATIPVIETLVHAFPRGKRLHIGILISDEVGNDTASIRKIVDILQRNQVCLHAVGVAGSCHEVLARETGGRFWDIHASRGNVDFSDLLDAIAVEITNLALR
jgi:molecular chaperone DnaK